MNRSLRPGNQRERGASAILFVMLLVAFAAMGSLVIDIGALRQEQRSLRNSADSAALAVARDCIDGDCADETATATDFSDDNADDGEHVLEEICGSDKAGNLSLTISACGTAPTLPPGATGYVKTKVHTKNVADNSETVTVGLGKIVGLTEQQVSSTSVVAWGPPKSKNTMALAMSYCEFLEAGGFGNGNHVLVHNWRTVEPDGSPTESTCDATSIGGSSTNKGGFTWLAFDTAGNITTNVGDVPADTNTTQVAGTGTPADTTDDQWSSAIPTYWSSNGPDGQPRYTQLRDATITVPLWEGDIACGTHWQWRIAGYAQFTVTGYSFGKDTKWGSGVGGCQDAYCIRGYFSKLVEDVSAEWAGDNFGTLSYKYVDA